MIQIISLKCSKIASSRRGSSHSSTFSPRNCKQFEFGAVQKVCKYCLSWKMLQKAKWIFGILNAKIGFSERWYSIVATPTVHGFATWLCLPLVVALVVPAPVDQLAILLRLALVVASILRGLQRFGIHHLYYYGYLFRSKVWSTCNQQTTWKSQDEMLCEVLFKSMSFWIDYPATYSQMSKNLRQCK